MSTSDKCDINNETYYGYGSRNSLNLPSHGYVPRWLGEISDDVVQNRPREGGSRPDKVYHLVDLNTLKDGSNIPSKISVAEGLTLEKRNTRPSLSKQQAKFGRRSSLASQIYARRTPRHIMLSKWDYLVPQLEGPIDFASLHKEINENDLEKSWNSLSTFQRTHKGRLDSARNDFDIRQNEMHTTTLDGYSPSILENKTPIRSKSEMSNYVPYYVYENIRKATEADESLGAINKAKSSEDIYYLPRRNSKQDPKGKHLTEYMYKVDQENRLRERIINELLNENERITERLRNRHINKRNSYEEVRRNYSHTPFLTSSIEDEQKDNLIESYSVESDANFIIPELPTGKILVFDILTTWGDRHYVGLNGIELFGSNGQIVDVKRITALPPDVNILPENKNDPRVVQNLLDGVNRTQDDVHLWLTPFDIGSKHTITIEFTHIITIAMIRIWNYNKSRIHSFRGVKDAVILLDGTPIFKGEIAKACGGILGGVHAFGDTILFTTDENILELISQNDRSYSTLTATPKPETPITSVRPSTVATTDSRPYTGALPETKKEIDSTSYKDQILFGANRMDIILISNWGYSSIIGLTGLEVIGASNNRIPLNEENITCSYEIRTVSLGVLFNEENITTDIGNMWWVPYKPERDIIISLQFNEFIYISGIRLWNYNQSPETTYAGVQVIKIMLDGKPLLNPIQRDDTFLLRRAPGNTHYDFVQDIRFLDISTNPNNYIELSKHLNSLSLYKSEMPEGFVIQFTIFSTWGDQYYCGLNEIELFNEYGEKILLEEQNICAYPESINVLPGVSGDIRTPDKLIDGFVDDYEGAHSWLAPIIPKCLNRIYIVLDQPITVSLIKLWNYSKTPFRGVKEFGVLVDDLLVYNGVLDKYVERGRGRPNYRSILFTNDKKIMEKEANTYLRHSGYRQEVLLLDGSRTTTGGSLPNPDQTLRPFTSVSPLDKGYVSQ